MKRKDIDKRKKNQKRGKRKKYERKKARKKKRESMMFLKEKKRKIPKKLKKEKRRKKKGKWNRKESKKSLIEKSTDINAKGKHLHATASKPICFAGLVHDQGWPVLRSFVTSKVSSVVLHFEYMGAVYLRRMCPRLERRSERMLCEEGIGKHTLIHSMKMCCQRHAIFL